MPKASVHKNDLLSGTKNQIRSPRNAPYSYTVAIPQSMDDSPYGELGCRVPASHGPHYLGALFFCDVIHRLPRGKRRQLTTVITHAGGRPQFAHGIALKFTIDKSPRSEEHTSELQSRVDLV